jgi:hypothetical protein
MVNDLDEALKRLLLEKGGIDGTEIDISFETPDREWSAAISRPTINLYLYDIRENCELRGLEWTVSKDEHGKATRKKNASRVDISYMITVWTSDVADMHRLLWHTLSTLFRYPELPPDVLAGPLQTLEYPIRAQAAQTDGLFNNPADFWSALDNQIRPSVNYIVTVPLDTGTAFTAPVVRTKVLSVRPI